MKIWAHVLASLILAALIYPLFGFKSILVFAGGVLVDFDHYIWFTLKYKKFGVYKCYKFYMEESRKENFKKVWRLLLAFHTIEFFVMMIVFSFFSKFIFLITLGLVLHYILDGIWYCRLGMLVPEISILRWILRNS